MWEWCAFYSISKVLRESGAHSNFEAPRAVWSLPRPKVRNLFGSGAHFHSISRVLRENGADSQFSVESGGFWVESESDLNRISIDSESNLNRI